MPYNRCRNSKWEPADNVRSVRMELQQYITFDAQISEEAGAESRLLEQDLAGHAIASFIANALLAHGMQCTDPDQHSFYGWAFEANDDGAAIWCLLQSPGPWLLITECRSAIVARLLNHGQRSKHECVIRCILDAMEADRRFSSIQVFTRAEYESRPQR